MSGGGLAIPPETALAQRRASDPTASAWVSANAGSGKTFVLVQRVKRLLLSGVEPGKILCLTFTKAAAANMANRLLEDLAGWVALDDDRLATAVADTTGRAPADVTRAELTEARRIFARALETPGGLRIQTIHAFCDALLHQFPFEADVAASFAVLDDAGSAELFERASAIVTARATANPDGVEAGALAALADVGDENRFALLIAEALKERDLVARLLPSLDDAPRLMARIEAVLALAPGDSIEAIDRAMTDEATIPEADWRKIAETIDALSQKSTDQKLAKAFRDAASLVDRQARATAYEAIFRTAGGEVRKFSSQFATKAITDFDPDLTEQLKAELDRFRALDERRKAVIVARVSHALVVLARAIIAEMETEKAERGLLDFSDLVARTNQLFASGRGDWVRWKLDPRIEHMLVDEAQDTSAAQWAVVGAITEDFFAGRSASNIARTLFAVGDDKQSIFSFQGAEPRLFDEKRRETQRAAAGARQRFEPVTLNLSFRSSPSVLEAVDAVFARPEAAAGVTSAETMPVHQAAKPNLPGVVEIWPVPPKPGKADTTGWRHSLDAIAEDDPKVVLAARIAEHIRHLASGTETVMGKDGPRPIRPGDVMILVRRRDTLFEAMIRSLKKVGVPVAGADRLVLVEHIAVMDLMALGDAVLLPEDDLTLATVLKSPLFGLDEDELYRLAHGRDRQTLLERLKAARDEPRFATAHDRLQTWRALADRVRPYEFYARILGPDGGRRAIEARLGREAIDAVDEFLERALAFDQGHTPSLQGFLDWMRETAVDVKREMSDARDEVRVMTAHNAKGLEAKVVILPDTTGLPGVGKPKLLHRVPSAVPDEPDLLLWSSSKDRDTGPLTALRTAAKDAAMEEYRRLLYVALTRAEERVLVAGLPDMKTKEGAPNADTWYRLIADALIPKSEAIEDDAGAVVRWLYQHRPCPPADGASAIDTAPAAIRPAWVDTPAPPVATRVVVAPSSVGDDDPVAGGTGLARIEARARGDLLHLLLERLPDLPEEKREAAARALATRRLPSQADAIVAEALGILRDPAYAAFFAADGIAEVPVIGEVTRADGTTVTVSGRIDRLVVTDRRILILDYKTGAVPASVPPAIRAQLGLYAAVLRRAYPDHEIAAAVLWTRAPRIDRVAQA